MKKYILLEQQRQNGDIVAYKIGMGQENYTVRKEVMLKLVNDGCIENVELSQTGKLMGKNGFKVSEVPFTKFDGRTPLTQEAEKSLGDTCLKVVDVSLDKNGILKAEFITGQNNIILNRIKAFENGCERSERSLKCEKMANSNIRVTVEVGTLYMSIGNLDRSKFVMGVTDDVKKKISKLSGVPRKLAEKTIIESDVYTKKHDSQLQGTSNKKTDKSKVDSKKLYAKLTDIKLTEDGILMTSCIIKENEEFLKKIESTKKESWYREEYLSYSRAEKGFIKMRVSLGYIGTMFKELKGYSVVTEVTDRVKNKMLDLNDEYATLLEKYFSIK